MINKSSYIFPANLSKKAVSTYYAVLIIIQVLFVTNFLPVMWIIISTFTAVMFFTYLHKLSKSWSQDSDAVFRKKIFKKALTIRIIAVVALYCFFQIMYDSPNEPNAADAGAYNEIGTYVTDYLLNGEFDLFHKLFYLDIADMGFPIYLGTVYIFVFKSILLSRILNAIIGARSCVVIYDFTKRNFNEAVARIAAIMMLLLPNMIYYCGLTLKETLMVFLVISFVNEADKVLKEKKLKFLKILLVTFLGGALFFFRTVLAVSMILSLFSSLFVMSDRVSSGGRKVFLGIWIIIGFVVIFNTSIGAVITDLINTRDSNQESQMQNFSVRGGGNAFAKYGSKAVFLPMILIAPFPTFVNINLDNQMLLGGAIFTRNIYAFFVILGLIRMYKQKLLRKHSLIIISFSSYLLILASSGFALSERFHMPAVPFLIIIAAYGVTQMDAKNTKNFSSYLIFIAIVLIGWNWFKLAGRGLI